MALSELLSSSSFKSKIHMLKSSRKISNLLDNSHETSRDRTRIEDNEDNLKVKSTPMSNFGEKKEIDDKSPEGVKTNLKMKHVVSMIPRMRKVQPKNFSASTISQFPQIQNKRPVTASVSCNKSLTAAIKVKRNERNSSLKKNSESVSKHNTSLTGKVNIYLNNSCLKRSTNEISQKNYFAVEKDRPSLYKNVNVVSMKNKAGGIIKKQLLKNLEFLIYRSNKV